MTIKQNEDEIDLVEIFKVIWQNKIIIFTISILFLILATIYIMLKTPIYEIKAYIEIGNYLDYSNSYSNLSSANNSNNTNETDKANTSNKILVDNAKELAKKLEIIYVDMFKNSKDKDTKIISVSVPKNQNNIIELKAESINNQLGKTEIEKIVQHISLEHQKFLDDVKEKKVFEINKIEKKIQSIYKNEATIYDKKIKLTEDYILKSEEQLFEIEEYIKKINKNDASLLAIKIVEKQNLSNFIFEKKLELIELENEKNALSLLKVNELKEEKNLLESFLSTHNYQNTKIIGNIITNENPAKPKTALILLVSLVTGVIISIFIIFLMLFLKNLKKEIKK